MVFKLTKKEQREQTSKSHLPLEQVERHIHRYAGVRRHSGRLSVGGHVAVDTWKHKILTRLRTPSAPAVSTHTFISFMLMCGGCVESHTHWIPVQFCPWGTPSSPPPRAPAACYEARPYGWAAWCPWRQRGHWRTCTPPAASHPAVRNTKRLRVSESVTDVVCYGDQQVHVSGFTYFWRGFRKVLVFLLRVRRENQIC